MFLKETKASGHTYLQVVQSYKDNGQTRHKVIANLGRLDKLKNNDSVKNIIIQLNKLILGNYSFNHNKVKGQMTFNWGYSVYKKLWKKYSLDAFLDKIGDSLGLKYPLNDVVFYEVLNHLMNPSSKLSGFNNRDSIYANLKTHDDINAFYRCLDVLAENKDKIENHIFQKNRSLFNMNVDVVFYDVTTFHFESVKSDELRNFGFSKAGKFNEVQVVLGMMVDLEGRPVGYELFQGNTFDSKTLVKALDSLNMKFGVRKVIIVADRGINSKMNLLEIKDRGFGYVVASKIKGMSNDIKNRIKDDNWDYVNEDDSFKYKVIDYSNKVYDPEKRDYHYLDENLIITYSDKRARKDSFDRARHIEKAIGYLKHPSKIKASHKKGAKRFIKELNSNTEKWVLDNNKINDDASYDGLYGIQTSEKNLNPRKVVDIKNSLWKIEESFRILKSTLQTRPVFHWTPKRIHGHFVLCFLAFLLERSLEIKAKNNNIQSSPEKLKEALNSLILSHIEIDDEDYYLKMKGNDLGNKLVRLFGVKSPPNLIEKDKLKI